MNDKDDALIKRANASQKAEGRLSLWVTGESLGAAALIGLAYHYHWLWAAFAAASLMCLAVLYAFKAGELQGARLEFLKGHSLYYLAAVRETFGDRGQKATIRRKGTS